MSFLLRQGFEGQVVGQGREGDERAVQHDGLATRPGGNLGFPIPPKNYKKVVVFTTHVKMNVLNLE